MNQRKLSNIILIFLCIFTFSYWGYLCQNSQMLISQDAVGYEHLGKEFLDGGIENYLKNGLTREPLYPMLISLSMKLSKETGDYRNIQKVFQLLALFLSQILLFLILSKANIDWKVKFPTVFYFGISPAMVNAALSLYSEILTLPCIMLMMIVIQSSWETLIREGQKKNILLSILTGVIFSIIIFIKAIFQYIFLVYIAVYVIKGLAFWAAKNKKALLRCVVYVILSTSIVVGSVTCYRFLNLKYNGHFDFTSRYAVLLFGNAGKRTENLSRTQLLAHLAAIPGESFCKKLFTKKECDYCTFKEADRYRSKHLPRLISPDLSKREREKEALKLSVNMFVRKPIQYVGLTFLEAFKMPFWESTRIGFVKYPLVVENIFNNSLFRNGIRLCMSVLTYLGLVFGLWFSAFNFFSFLRAQKSYQEEKAVVFFSCLIILTFTGLYSLFSILTRFAFPIVPLYCVLIAFFLDSFLNKKKLGDKL